MRILLGRFLAVARRARALTASSQLRVLRTFTEPAPVEIVRAWGARELYDSLILANVARIAKYGRVSHSARPDDGLFEVVCCRHGARWRIALMALRAALVGMGNQPRVSELGFVTPQSVPFRIDGEVLHLEAGSQVVVECVPHALTTVG
jgi:diacylglycerol kinase (ATP)